MLHRGELGVRRSSLALGATVLVQASAAAQVPRLFEELPAIGHAVVPRVAIATDVDGDQAPDLVRIDGGIDAVKVLVNDGTGRMGPECAIAVAADPRDVIAVDWDGDGDQDLLVAARADSKVSLLVNQHPQTAAGCPVFARQDLPVIAAPVRVRVADLNADGALDIVVASDVGVYAYWSGAGSGVVLNPGVVGFKNPVAVELVDLDGDQRLDLAIASGGMAAPYRLDLVWNDMTLGTTTWAATITNWINAVGTGAVASALAVGDLDGDGLDDLAVAYVTHPLAVVRNQGGGNRFLSFVPAAVGQPGSSLVATDVDQDGARDLVYVSAGDQAVIHYNRHAGDVSQSTAQDEELRPLEPGLVAVSLSPGDLDRDGDVDLALAARAYAAGWVGRDPLLFNQTNANVRQPAQGLLLRGASASGSLADLQVPDQSYLRLSAADPTLARTAYRASFFTGTLAGNTLRVTLSSRVQGSLPALAATLRVHAWNWATQKLNPIGVDTVGVASHTTQLQLPVGSFRSAAGNVVIVVHHTSQIPGSAMDTYLDLLSVEILP